MVQSPTRSYTKKITRKGIINLVEEDTGIVLVMNRPTSMELDNGLADNQPITELDSQGYETEVANNFNSRKPSLNLTFGGRNLDIVALSLDRKTQTTTVSLRYPARQQILKANYAPSPAGKLGNRVLKNADTKASFQNFATGETQLLTQQLFDSFNPAIPKSFAIGDQFERKFSNDLVDANNWVALLPSADYAARSLSEASIGFLEVWGLCFYTDDATEIISVPRCFINPEGAGLKNGDTTVQLKVSGLGKCQPWNLFEIPDEVYCED